MEKEANRHTKDDTETMAEAIWGAALMLQSNAKPEMNYWHYVKQLVEMMELYETTKNAETLRNLRMTKTDDQGRLFFLLRGIKGAANIRQAGTTEWVIKRNTTGA